MTRSVSILLLLTAIGFSGCNQEKVIMRRMLGEWSITESVRLRIMEDGQAEVFEDLQDAGTLSVYEDILETQTLKGFTLNYTNFLGQVVALDGLLYADESARRVFMSSPALCNGQVFECDIVWTVEENERGQQVWSTYGGEDVFFYPPERYNANNNASHLKWSITLERQ